MKKFFVMGNLLERERNKYDQEEEEMARRATRRRAEGPIEADRRADREASAGNAVDGQNNQTSSAEKIIELTLAKKQFKLLNKIGEGSYATVYRVKRTDVARDKRMAAKVIELKKVKNSYRMHFVRRELKAVQAVSHKFIIRVYEIIQNYNCTIIIMEQAWGSLADLLQKYGLMKESSAKKRMGQMLSALDYIHDKKLAHRDLKLENILLIKDKNGYINAKLADFGHSKFHVNRDGSDRIPLSATFCGTLPYFPPEILQRKQYNAFQADVWSIGVCHYIMLNDGLPFSIKEENEMLKKQLTKDWKFRDRCLAGEACRAFLNEIFEPDALKRPSIKTLINSSYMKEQMTRLEEPDVKES